MKAEQIRVEFQKIENLQCAAPPTMRETAMLKIIQLMFEWLVELQSRTDWGCEACNPSAESDTSRHCSG